MDELKKYFIIEREYEHGKFNMRCVGIYDIERILEEDRLDLLDDTHPINFKFFLMLSKLKEKNTENERSASSMAFFVALEEDNLEKKNKSKQLITPKEIKKIIKWQQSGEGYFTPSYLDNIRNLEDLKNNYKNQSGFKI